MITRGVLRPITWLLVCAVVAVPWFAVVRQLSNAHPAAESSVAPTAVLWAGRVFTSGRALDLWLRSRGSSYDEWARLHHDTSTIFESSRPAVAPGDTSADARSAPNGGSQVGHASARTKPAVQAPLRERVALAQRIGEIALLLLSGLAIAVGLAPPEHLRRIAHVSASPEFRIAAVGAGITIAVVVATVSFIG